MVQLAFGDRLDAFRHALQTAGMSLPIESQQCGSQRCKQNRCKQTQPPDKASVGDRLVVIRRRGHGHVEKRNPRVADGIRITFGRNKTSAAVETREHLICHRLEIADRVAYLLVLQSFIRVIQDPSGAIYHDEDDGLAALHRDVVRSVFILPCRFGKDWIES